MKKLAVLLLVLVSTLTFLRFNGLGLVGAMDKTDLNVGVYATGKNNRAVFDKCFSHGFIDEIFGVTPEVFYSYDGGGKVVGEFFTADANKFNYQKFASEFGLIVTRTSQVDEVFNIYARSALLPYRVSGVDSNIQIAIDNNIVTVASPIIFGSF